MPIMSFSISEDLKKIIQGLVSRKKVFKNQSNFVRTALNAYINSDEVRYDFEDGEDGNDYKIHGQIFLSFKRDENEQTILRNILKAEQKYSDYISSFQLVSSDINYATVMYCFDGNIFEFRSFVDELDSLKEIGQLRYIISS